MKKNRMAAACLVWIFMVGMLVLPGRALEAPELFCSNALLLDAKYGEVLYEKNGYDRAYPASMTKVLTALLVLEAVEEGQLTLETSVTASAQGVEVPRGSSSTDPPIREGEVLTIQDLLYCLMLPSSNQAANLLAEAVSGDIETFVDAMNRRARELGAQGTHFTNPHGYHNPNHYSTAYDIALFMQEAMKHETFRTIVASLNYTVPATNMSKKRVIYSTNGLVSNWTYAGYLYTKRGLGGKTGTTAEAGRCLVQAAQDGTNYFISVIMGSGPVPGEDGKLKQGQFTETIKLLDWGFANFRRTTLAEDSDPVAAIKVTLSRQTDQVLLKPQGTIVRTLPKGIDLSQIEKTINLFSESVEAPVKEGQVLGTMLLSYQGEEYGTLDLVAVHDVERSELLYKKTLFLEFLRTSGTKVILVLVALSIGVMLLRLLFVQKKRRQRNHSGAGSSRGGRHKSRQG